MKQKWRIFLLCVALPLAVGGLSAWLSRGAMEDFAFLDQPPLSPPGWLFPVVWTVLYILMGLASYRVAMSEASRPEKSRALRPYGLQLFFNFFWSILFFNGELYLLAFVWLVVLWSLIAVTALRFYAIDKTAGYLLVPYLLWVTFAGYLNLGIYLLNL